MHRIPFFIIAKSCLKIGGPCVVLCTDDSYSEQPMQDVDRSATMGNCCSVWGKQATLIKDYIDCSARRLLSDNRPGQLSAVWPDPYW